MNEIKMAPLNDLKFCTSYLSPAVLVRKDIDSSHITSVATSSSFNCVKYEKAPLVSRIRPPRGNLQVTFVVCWAHVYAHFESCHLILTRLYYYNVWYHVVRRWHLIRSAKYFVPTRIQSTKQDTSERKCSLRLSLFLNTAVVYSFFYVAPYQYFDLVLHTL